jgi:hypothetical protein
VFHVEWKHQLSEPGVDVEIVIQGRIVGSGSPIHLSGVAMGGVDGDLSGTQDAESHSVARSKSRPKRRRRVRAKAPVDQIDSDSDYAFDPREAVLLGVIGADPFCWQGDKSSSTSRSKTRPRRRITARARRTDTATSRDGLSTGGLDAFFLAGAWHLAADGAYPCGYPGTFWGGGYWEPPEPGLTPCSGDAWQGRVTVQVHGEADR